MRFQHCMNSNKFLIVDIRAIQGHTGGNLIAPELMGHVATNGKNSCFIEDVRLMSLQSSNQDSSLEDEKAKKEDRPYSSHLSTRSKTIQTKKNLAITYQNREKYTITVSGKYSGRRLLDQLSPSTRQTITILADKVSCCSCIQLCAGRLHLQSDFQKQGKGVYLKDSRRLLPHRRMYLRVLGNRSSSKTPLSVRLPAPGNWCREEQCNPTDNPELRLNLKSTSESKELHKM